MIRSMLNAGTLTFNEFAMCERLPLATIHDAVLEFLRGRDVMETWRELVAQKLVQSGDDAEFG